MKYFLIHTIRIYQNIFSPDKGFLVRLGLKKPQTCVFYPTCSDYSIKALQKYGLTKGIKMSIKRILKCHPWQKPTVDTIE